MQMLYACFTVCLTCYWSIYINKTFIIENYLNTKLHWIFVLPEQNSLRKKNKYNNIRMFIMIYLFVLDDSLTS